MTVPWTAAVRERTLIVTFPALYRVLSWAPLGGGLREAKAVLNHQVRTDDYPAYEAAVYLQALARRLDVPLPAVGLMTGVQMGRLVRKVVRQDLLSVECFATVGLSNALTVGDPATYEERPGTINLIVLVNQPLLDAALAEAVAITTEAKVRALYAARVKSTVSDALATGTGTDCVAVACPPGTPAYEYCGKHTRLGELLGQVVYDAVTEGLRQAHES
ncbi:MAG: adenosylcobinamide amidohydrolase [Thermodesulfobacteriota bacterium]|jgi:adenosylcobinamide amidohydrolase